MGGQKAVSKRYEFHFLAASLVAGALVGCAQSGGGGGSSADASASAGKGLENSYKARAVQIIQSNCVSCHKATTGSGGVFGLTDTNHLVSANLVVPGQPSKSSIYTAITSGAMPPGGHVSLSDQQTISQWIAAAATPTPTPKPTATPTASATPTPTPSATPVTFTVLKNTIFTPKCVSCHKAGLADGGYAFDTYNGVKAGVNTGNPTASAVYTSTSSGAMPKNGTALTSTQLSQLLGWIQAGAPNN